MMTRTLTARLSVAVAMAVLVVLLTVSAAFAQSYVEVIGDQPEGNGIGGAAPVTEVRGVQLQLAATGVDSEQLAMLGFGALGFGAAALVASRRTRKRASQR